MLRSGLRTQAPRAATRGHDVATEGDPVAVYLREPFKDKVVGALVPASPS